MSHFMGRRRPLCAGFAGILLVLLLALMPQTAEAATKIKGIDVSKWQGTVNWEKVKQDGVKFVMLGLGRYRNGKGIPDPNFKYNIQNALKQGIHVGVYLYSEAGSVKEAREEARYVLDQIDGYKISYPVAFDIEDDIHRRMTTKKRTDIAIAFLEVIEEAGYYPMIYASENWFRDSMDLSRLTKYDKWVARWADSVSFRPLAMWQYSSRGRIAGINGNVDLDYSYRDYASMITPRTHAAGKNGETQSEENPEVGWQKEGSKYWYRKEDGSRAKKGWLKIDGKKYYLNEKGYRAVGWVKHSGKYYYFDPETGAMQTGWLTVGKKTYYLKKSGARATGWVTVGKKRYYLNENGVRQSGWLTVDGNRYYLNPDGTLKTSWLKLGGKKYLLGTKTGKMCTGWTKYQGKCFYFSKKTGVMKTGWLTLGGKKYYLEKDGNRASGWTRLGEKWYYFNKKDGVMKRSCKVGRYVFDEKGICANYTG